MDRLSLSAEERKILGKKVKKLRKDGKLPGHIFGKGVESESVCVDGKTFLKTFQQVRETGLIDLKISKLAANTVSKLAADAVGTEKVRPVLIRGVQYDPVSGQPIHIDFYQVDMTKKVKVPVPLILIGDQPESVRLNETIVLQTLHELEIEALPIDLVEKIEVDITPLKNIDDAVTVGQLNFDRSKLTIHAVPEEIVVKLAPAVTEEMKKQMEEEAAEAAAKAAETAAKEGAVPVEGAGVEGVAAEGEAVAEGKVSGQPTEGEQPKTEAVEGKEKPKKG